MITISVCMIVKNEEKVLKRCLDSLSDIYDELVIVDTGSTDKTKAIARNYTKKVYDFKWIDDFAAARNFANTKATKEYIYSADADDYIDEENRQKFLLLKEALLPEIEAVEMMYGNLLENSTTFNFDKEYKPKLFKRLREFKFIDPVHETLNCNVVSFQSDVIIAHMPHAKNTKRDLGIFKKVTDNLSDGAILSPKLHQFYAKELYLSGDKDDFMAAMPYFKKSLENENITQDAIREAQCILAHAYRISGDEYNFMKECGKNIIGTPSAEICCELGDYYMSKNDPDEAAIWYFTAANGAQSELSYRHMNDIPNEMLKQIGFTE